MLENVMALTTVHKELDRKTWLRRDRNTGALKSKEDFTFQTFKNPYPMHRRLTQALFFRVVLFNEIMKIIQNWEKKRHDMHFKKAYGKEHALP